MQPSTIVIGIGQAGLKTATEFWIELCRQHRIDPHSGSANEGATGNWKRFFARVAAGSEDERYVPRALFFDSDSRIADELKVQWRELFNPASFATGEESSGNNFAVAYNEVGGRLASDIRNLFLRERDRADRVDSCIVFHGYGGGSGAGLATRAFEVVRHIEPAISLLSVGILPSQAVSSSVTEPYNAVYGLRSVSRHCTAGLLLRNENVRGQLSDLNQEIAQTVAAFTGPARFADPEGELRLLPDLIAEMAPHPEFIFFSGTQLRLSELLRKNAAENGVSEILDHLLEKHADRIPALGGTIFSLFLASQAMERVHQPSSSSTLGDFAESVLSLPVDKEDGFVSVFVNSSQLGQLLEHVCQSFDALWQRKAFATWFIEAGFSESEIETLRRELGFLRNRYREVEP